jgi:hypothetical protein
LNSSSQVLLPSGLPAKPDQDKESIFSFSKIPDAFTILWITILGYSGAFAYEAGFCKFFGIPWNLIRIDTTTLLNCGVVALTFLWLTYGFIAILYMCSELSVTLWGKHLLFDWLFSAVPFASVVLLVGYFEDFKGSNFIFVLTMFFLLKVVGELVPPLLLWMKRGKDRSYVYYFHDWKHHEKENPTPSLISAAAKHGLGVPIVMLFSLYLSVYFCYNMGKKMASNTDVFLYRSEPRSEIVARVYGDTGITLRVDENAIIYPEFTFIKLEDQTNGFILTKTGRLTPMLSLKRIQDFRQTNVVQSSTSLLSTETNHSSSSNKPLLRPLPESATNSLPGE